MSMHVTLDVSDEVSAGLRKYAAGLEDLKPLYDRIAGDAEDMLKKHGQKTSATEHKTAETLGATPTGHLEQAYQGIEGISTAERATLLVPGYSRLRAAFGKYVLTPKNGSKYLTIPVHAEAYGKRAREIDDLFFMRTGNGVPVLARRVEGIRNEGLARRPGQRRAARRFTQAEVMYVLAREATINEDRNLIPFDDLQMEAEDSARLFLIEKKREL